VAFRLYYRTPISARHMRSLHFHHDGLLERSSTVNGTASGPRVEMEQTLAFAFFAQSASLHTWDEFRNHSSGFY
jgi:hypothetical protein